MFLTLLRLHLPGELIEDGRENASYDVESGTAPTMVGMAHADFQNTMPHPNNTLSVACRHGTATWANGILASKCN